MGEMRIMSPLDGDKVINWDPEDPASVEKARKAFEKHTEKGHKAYEVKNEPVAKGKPIKNFNAKKGSYILVPGMAGG